jgi:hypothetical protein
MTKGYTDKLLSFQIFFISMAKFYYSVICMQCGEFIIIIITIVVVVVNVNSVELYRRSRITGHEIWK